MNKTMKTAAALLLMALPLLTTSCDDDTWHERPPRHFWYDDYDSYLWTDRGNDNYDYESSDFTAEAQCLRGHWDGTITYTYTNLDGERETVQFDADMEFDQYDNSENPLRGRGKEVDTAGDEQQTLYFSWYVDERNGNIFIQYDGTKSTYVLDAESTEHGFYLDSDRFNGYMIGTTNDDVLLLDLQRYTYAKPNLLGKAPAKETAKTAKTYPERLVKR